MLFYNCWDLSSDVFSVFHILPGKTLAYHEKTLGYHEKTLGYHVTKHGSCPLVFESFF